MYIKTTTSSGEPKSVKGKVDYVMYENGKAYLSINESLYALDDLEIVVDQQYQDAFDKAYDFNIRINKLPAPGGIDMSDAKEIDELEKIYNEMNDYEKSFVAEDVVKMLNKYVERLEEVRLAAGEGDKDPKPDEVEKPDGTEKPDEVEKPDGTEKPGEGEDDGTSEGADGTGGA